MTQPIYRANKSLSGPAYETASERNCQGAAVEYKAINPTALGSLLAGDNTTILGSSVYASILSASILGELEEFCESIRDVLGRVREKLKIFGDLNGRFGTARSGYKEVLAKYGDKIINNIK